MTNNKDNKPLTLEDLAGLIKAETTFIREDLTGLIKGETARLEEKIEATEKNLNESIEHLAAMTKSEFERVDEKVSRIDSELTETKLNTRFLRDKFGDMKVELESKVSRHEFERVIKQNGLKTDLELVQTRGRLHR